MDAATRRIGLVLALGGLMVVVDTSVTIVAVPAMVVALDSTLPTLQWVTTGYILGLVAVMPLAGWAANRFGDRRVYLLALTLFVLASVVAGAAWDATSLIAFRMLQGLAGGLLNPVGMAIALRSAPVGARGKVMSLLGLPVVIGPVLGPPLAGMLVDAASWRWVFWINLPVGLAAWLLCRRHLPTPLRAEARRIDWWGLAAITGGSGLLVLGCTWVGEAGRLTLTAGCAVAGGLVLVGGFALRSRRQASSLLEVRLLSHRRVAGGALVLLTFAAAYFGAMTLLPAFVQGVRGDSVAVAGTLSVPTGIAVGLTLQVATRLVDRLAPRRILLVGTGTGLTGFLLLWLAVGDDASYLGVATLSAVVGVGSGATLMPTMTAATRALEGPDIPHGTTLLNLVSQLGAALGTAAVATTLTLLVDHRAPALGRGGDGGLAAMVALDDATRARLQPHLAEALGTTYLLPATLTAIALAVALVFMGTPRRRPREPEDHPVMSRAG